MSDIAVKNECIPEMTEAAIRKVKIFEIENARRPQISIATKHVIHGGMYARTIRIPADFMLTGKMTALTGALIKVPTMLIVAGNVIVYIGDEARELCGYNVLAASANRKQVFLAKTDTCLTMVFPTKAKSVEEAEREFTDEAQFLISRKEESDNEVVITGE